jgi:5-methylcytosine-specific restriction endonuclease McrA
MPSWLTETQREQMNALYETARRLTEQTGILHVVDHIWPLKGATAWGLHAPWNLQVLTGNENDSKGNKEPDSSGWYIEMEYSVAAE